jgi:hypothetical protein
MFRMFHNRTFRMFRVRTFSDNRAVFARFRSYIVTLWMVFYSIQGPCSTCNLCLELLVAFLTPVSLVRCPRSCLCSWVNVRVQTSHAYGVKTTCELSWLLVSNTSHSNVRIHSFVTMGRRPYDGHELTWVLWPHKRTFGVCFWANIRCRMFHAYGITTTPSQRIKHTTPHFLREMREIRGYSRLGAVYGIMTHLETRWVEDNR